MLYFQLSYRALCTFQQVRWLDAMSRRFVELLLILHLTDVYTNGTVIYLILPY